MPLDNADFIPEDYQKLLHLARKLRDRDFGFVWDYTRCDTCALAVGKAVLGVEAWYSFFGLPEKDFCQIFAQAGRTVNKRMQDVEPEDVAEVIEQVVEAKVYSA